MIFYFVSQLVKTKVPFQHFSTPPEQESTRSVSEKAFISTESVVHGENDNEIMSFALVGFFCRLPLLTLVQKRETQTKI